ncbi:ATP-dependent DNA ligase [Terriglobus roseus]|uniref:DNA ligase n=1 Tax=Terriglobus roseus TaxID=392734 RepID=A0A1G7NKS9_9BACT|nr:ATP-dependent DNA ligase [Terriglobus roseus]SDF73889.1 DNA ligase-1 [Terriglobus roseus]
MALFLHLATLGDELVATSSKLRKRAAIAERLVAVRREGSVEDAGLLALYLSGEVFPEADTRKLSIGGAMLSRVLRDIVRPTEEQFTAAWRRHGDIGAAAGDLFAEQGHTPEPSLTFAQVAEAFAAIPVAKTTAQRQALLTGLLERCSPVEAKYLVKLISGDMRIGVKQALIEEAIAVASEQPLAEVRNAVMLEADLARATVMAFEGALREARMRLFHPLGFMLASPVDTPEEAVKRFASKPEAAEEAGISVPPESHAEPEPHVRAEDESALDDAEQEHAALQAIHLDAQVEDKFDGMRVQLHFGSNDSPGRVALYSRNREDVTASYPEIVEAFAAVNEAVIGDGSGVILDGELLAWDVRSDRALPFAMLSPRIGRKKVTNEVRRGTPVVYMAFDILFAHGELLLDLPLSERRRRLEALTARIQTVTLSPLEAEAPLPSGGLFSEAVPAPPQGEQRLRVSQVVEAHSAGDLDRAYVAARDRGNEGVMIKSSGSLYQPGRRGLSWIKLKRHLDTLDVVITGAEYGHGRRSQVLSDYTFAVRASDGSLQNVGKAYGGLTDAEIVELTDWSKAHTLEDYGHFRSVEPLMVLEIAFNNIMRSDRHASGFALRFPRIVQIRRDKSVDDIDTVERVEEIYQSQPDKPVEQLPST